MLAVIPFLWAIYITAKEKRYHDAFLETIIFICVIIHFYLFYSKYYLMLPASLAQSILSCCSTSAIIPVLFTYVCRRIGISYTYKSLTLFVIGLLSFIPQGVLSFGFNDLPAECMPKDMFRLNIFVNGKLFLQPMTYSMAVIFQALFSSYRIGFLMRAMSIHNYHYSSNYKRFVALLAVAALTILLSYLPNDDFWYKSWTSIACVFVFMLFLGIGFSLIALRFDHAPIEDENNEPVSIEEAPRRFKKMAMKFTELITLQKLHLQSGILMDDVAKLLGTNRTYVAQMMKEEYGTTFTSYINKMRVEEAKRILTHDSEISIQELATKSGFNSTSAFNKSFKSLTGVSPSEWKPEPESVS